MKSLITLLIFTTFTTMSSAFAGVRCQMFDGNDPTAKLLVQFESRPPYAERSSTAPLETWSVLQYLPRKGARLDIYFVAVAHQKDLNSPAYITSVYYLPFLTSGDPLKQKVQIDLPVAKDLQEFSVQIKDLSPEFPLVKVDCQAFGDSSITEPL